MTGSDFNKIYLKLLKEVKSSEIYGKRKEKYFSTFILTDLNKNVLFFPFAQRNWAWILRETMDRIFEVKNPGEAWQWSKNWENRKEENGLYSYHYANRLNTQMKVLLSKNKHSREKIVSVWRLSDNVLSGRKPCTISLQPFMENDNKMSLLVHMRNNDIINLLPSDVFIHSTYFKYWSTYYDIEYKNLYWVAAILYYQKRREETHFVDRLLENWKINYSNNIKTTKWNKDIIEDLKKENEFELKTLKDSNISHLLDFESSLKTEYVKDWNKFILLNFYKKKKNKKFFNEINNKKWYDTEFDTLRRSVKFGK